MSEREAIFYGMIENIDENVGTLRDWLEEEGLSEKTLFIFTTDNGTASGENLFSGVCAARKVVNTMEAIAFHSSCIGLRVISTVVAMWIR